MREVQIADAKAHLPQLIDAVERGETVIITRHGRAVARIVPETEGRASQTRQTMQEIAAFRQTMPRLSLAEIQEALRSLVHIPPVPDPNHENFNQAIIDMRDDAIITDPVFPEIRKVALQSLSDAAGIG